MGSPRQLCCPLWGRETHGKEQNKNTELQHGRENHGKEQKTK